MLLKAVLLDIARAVKSTRKEAKTASGANLGPDAWMRRGFAERIEALSCMAINRTNGDEVLRECAAIEQSNPYIPSGFQWILEYSRFQVAANRGNQDRALAHLRAAIALVPYHVELVERYKRLVKKDSTVTNLVLIITCSKYAEKALALARQLEASGIRYLIVTGSDTNAIEHPRALQVDARDNYESLPRKIGAALRYVYEGVGTNVGVLKVDDDQTLFDPARLKSIMDELYRADAYAGVPVSGETHDRNWHWDKCEDSVLNRRSYGRPYVRRWAMGGAYYLGPGPVERVVLALTRFPGLFEGEYYEDKLVGDTLAAEGLDLTAVPGYESFGLRLKEFHRFNSAGQVEK